MIVTLPKNNPALAPGAFRKYQMCFVHQHLGLIPSLTVLENLLVGRLAERAEWAINWRAERSAAEKLFASFDIGPDPDAKVASIPAADSGARLRMFA